MDLTKILLFTFTMLLEGGGFYTKDPLTMKENDQLFSDKLPVELLFFIATSETSTVTLEWATASEVNNYGFNIERSFQDSLHFEAIGFVPGSGTSTSRKDYFYIDDPVTTSGLYFYRLKQIDREGSFKYSNIVSVYVLITNIQRHPNPFVEKSFKILNCYPNPFNPSITIRFTLSELNLVILRIFYLLCKENEQLINGYRSAGEYEVKWSPIGNPSNIYFIFFKSGDKIYFEKVIYLK